MLPRVVITGLGVVSPNGIGKEEFCRAILAGRSGVRRISRFDPTDLPVHIAGEIPDFDESQWVDPRERKHVSRVVPLAIAASSEALKDAGLDPASVRTNCVLFRHDDTPDLLAHLAREGIRAGTIAPRIVRLMTHLDVDEVDVEQTRKALASSP